MSSDNVNVMKTRQYTKKHEKGQRDNISCYYIELFENLSLSVHIKTQVKLVTDTIIQIR